MPYDANWTRADVSTEGNHLLAFGHDNDSSLSVRGEYRPCGLPQVFVGEPVESSPQHGGVQLELLASPERKRDAVQILLEHHLGEVNYAKHDPEIVLRKDNLERLQQGLSGLLDETSQILNSLLLTTGRFAAGPASLVSRAA